MDNNSIMVSTVIGVQRHHLWWHQTALNCLIYPKLFKIIYYVLNNLGK